MNRFHPSIRPPVQRNLGTGTLLFLPIIILCSLALIAPLNATQRMVLAEEYTNSG